MLSLLIEKTGGVALLRLRFFSPKEVQFIYIINKLSIGIQRIYANPGHHIQSWFLDKNVLSHNPYRFSAQRI